jgi:hypothetical protein
MSDELASRIDEVFDASAELSASQHDRFTVEVQRVLGDPVLVTDPRDGITRPTWTVEIPWDALERLCRASNARTGLDNSEGGATD